MPTCSTCNDTHMMPFQDREVMCTRCPLPCPSCARGPFCKTTPCRCGCHSEPPADDPIRELDALLKEAGLRPTFDQDRSIAKPCVICGEDDKPRELITIGTYTRRMGGNLQPGDRIERPMCKRCEELTR